MSEVFKVKRLALKYIRKYDGILIYNKNFRKLDHRTCFEDVTEDGTNTIYLIPRLESDFIGSAGVPDMQIELLPILAASQPKVAFNAREGEYKRRKVIPE